MKGGTRTFYSAFSFWHVNIGGGGCFAFVYFRVSNIGKIRVLNNIAEDI